MAEPLRCCIELANGLCDGQPVAIEADGIARCLTHATDPVRVRRREERNAKGGQNRLRTLPADTRVPKFDTLRQVQRYAERVAHRVETGQLARQVAETVLRAASLGLQVHQLRNQERLTEALLRMQHGEAAVALLARLQDVTAGARRPLPGRVHVVPASAEPAS